MRKKAIKSRPVSRSKAFANRHVERSSWLWRRSASARPISDVHRYCSAASTTRSKVSAARVSHSPRSFAFQSTKRV